MAIFLLAGFLGVSFDELSERRATRSLNYLLPLLGVAILPIFPDKTGNWRVFFFSSSVCVSDKWVNPLRAMIDRFL